MQYIFNHYSHKKYSQEICIKANIHIVYRYIINYNIFVTSFKEYNGLILFFFPCLLSVVVVVDDDDDDEM